MEETILYLGPIEWQRPQYQLQMITTIDTVNSGTQPAKLLSLPEFGLRGLRLREEHHALRYLLEDKYWSLETGFLQNQGDQRGWNLAGVDHSQC